MKLFAEKKRQSLIKLVDSHVYKLQFYCCNDRSPNKEADQYKANSFISFSLEKTTSVERVLVVEHFKEFYMYM